MAKEIAEIFNAVVTRNEVEWLVALRKASGGADPAITKRVRIAIFQIFGK